MKFLALFLTFAIGFLFAAVNINTATKKELESLKGIGTKKAEAIIEYRKVTPFKTIEDLKKVVGISDKLFDSIKSQISVEGETKIEKQEKKPAKKDTK